MARVLAKTARAVVTQTSAIVVDRPVIGDLIALVDTKVAVSVADVGHMSQVCRSSGGNASAQAVEVDPAEPEEEREIQHLWALSVCDISGISSDALSVCDNSDLPSGESGYLLNMIMDSGAEEHVVSLADLRQPGSRCCLLLKFACAVRLVTTWEFLAVLWCEDGAI